ncbi:hypothetical protein FRB94_000793 [Tulasnella sp. JGI-2019a]|nr:hypothetical protein FRB94_000793 [Tulasnella sp. JGI-2019a]
MAIFKPATPGFLTTLTATILLGVVSFSVPYFKTIYFLQASYSTSGQSGLINIGTLGYCLVVNGATTCTKPSIGYEFDPNTLLGDTSNLLQIPTVITKWITYALFLHVIAFGLAGISAIFGLLAHIREFSMVCFSSCISGLAASIALLAFIFDIVLFYVARTRIRSIQGATATIGMAIWLTLAAWILLFISGCMFGIGRCCIGSRPRNPRSAAKPDSFGGGAAGAPTVDQSYAERMRMEAIRAEVDRKAQQKNNTVKEGGLPIFEEHQETTPLSAEDELPGGINVPYRDGSPSPYNRFGAAGAATGYVPSPRRQASARSDLSQNNQGHGAGYGGGYGGGGGDYNPTMPSPGVGYPPSQPSQQSLAAVGGPPQRQLSLGERNIYDSAGLPAVGVAAGGAVAVGAANEFLRPGSSVHGRGDSYGHHTQATSYHSAISQQQHASQYGERAYDNYAQDTSTSAGQYGNATQGYNQSGYTHQQYGDQQHYNQPYDPYSTPAQAAYSSYPGHSSSPVNTYPSGGNQYPPHSSPSPHRSTTTSPPQQAPSVSPQFGYPPTPAAARGSYTASPNADLNFPGVPAPLPTSQDPYGRSPPPSQIDPYGGYTQQSPSRSRTLNSYQQSIPQPTRLPGVREQSEPSTTGPPQATVHTDAPPVYDGPGPSQPYRSEKAIYTPSPSEG